MLYANLEQSNCLGRMDNAYKVVTHLPLAELWRDDGFTRVRWLTAEDIAGLLRVGRVQFVVADVGARFAGFHSVGATIFGRKRHGRIWQRLSRTAGGF